MIRNALNIFTTRSVILFVPQLLFTLLVCQSCKESPPSGDSNAAQSDAGRVVASEGVATKATAEPRAEIGSAGAVVVSGVGFKTPESVYYDASRDVYLVSNINGSPLEKDNNGFISKLSPNGELIDRRWLSGNQNGVTLHAPKGMTISDGLLYVADIDKIRIFDPETGHIKGKIAIPNASFLNDLSSAPDTTLYVSDTGWKKGPAGFVSGGSDSVWRIKNGNAKKLVGNKEIQSPNGVLALRRSVLLVNAHGHIFEIDADGAFRKLASLPGKRLDGIVQGPAGKLLISSWETRTVYEGDIKGGFKPVAENITSPADIGYDTKRQRLLVPVFQQDEVRIIPLTSE